MPAWLRPWRLLPAYVINGIATAFGIGTIQLLTSALAGPHAAAQLFRSRADVLVSYRVLAGEAPPLGAWISGEATLADRLQAARDLVYPAVHSARWQRDVALVLRVVDLRDALLTSRLDVDLLGSDAAGREILERTAGALREVGAQLDAAADALRDG